MSESNVPNLDESMTADELMQFWKRHQRGANYRALFPSGGNGTRLATADLANYASNKAAAIRCRERGNITGAQMYEGICDKIYSELPDFAKAW
jgi:hypothetical protein